MHAPRAHALLRILRRRRPVGDDVEDEPGDGPIESLGPADVLRDGPIFWSQCLVCPWEGEGRFLHIAAAIDAAQHNLVIHQTPLPEPTDLPVP